MSGEHRVDRGTTTDALEQQRRVVAALCDPRAYPHPVTAVRLVETHISFVLLTGQYAYKLKKPLALGFLDFSTLAARRFFCGEELRLNGRLAPRLYLDVVAITGEPDRPQLGGTGPVLDYAVRMVEFPQSALLDTMLARGALTPPLVDALAEAVARFHGAIERAPIDSPFGDPAQVHAPMRQNFEQLAPLLDDDAERAPLAALRDWSESECRRLAPAFAARRAGGFVRECHGDLHVGNIALVDGELQIFDGIEFNANLRWIDVASEIAFLTMDLGERGHPGLAARLLDTYLQATGDYEGLGVLRYYLVYRALVRAKVARLRAGQERADDPDRAAELAICRDYVGVATLLAAPRPVALLVTHGVSGAGKTFRSQQLLEALDAIRVRSDVERRRLFGNAGAAGEGAAGRGNLRRGGDAARLRAAGATRANRARRRLPGDRRRDVSAAAAARRLPPARRVTRHPVLPHRLRGARRLPARTRRRAGAKRPRRVGSDGRRRRPATARARTARSRRTRAGGGRRRRRRTAGRTRPAGPREIGLGR